jgi:hypothetical protein
MCYNRPTAIQVFGRVLPPITCFICQIIMDYLNPIINACVLNQFANHWLLFDAL